MKAIWGFLVNHGTKVIGFVQGTVAAIATSSDLIPEKYLKFVLAAGAVLTFWRGFFNSSQQEK
jgi:hypothetical protein